MPSTTDTIQPHYAQTVTIVAAGAMSMLTLILLAAGTIDGHPGLVAWAMVCGMIALDLIVLLAIKHMIDAAVRQSAEDSAELCARAVNETAITVGAAIAASLREEEQADHPDVPRIYSR